MQVRFRLLLAVLLAWLVLPVSAQQTGVEDYASVQKRGLSPGIMQGTASFQGRRGITDLLFVEADLSMPLVSAELLFPGANPHAAPALESLAGSVRALSAMALEPAGLGDSRDALRTGGGRLYAWPPDGGLHLMLQPEGAFRLGIPEPGRGVIDFDNGTSMTLVSVNGRFPTRSGEAAVYTGLLRAGELPVASWIGNPVAIVLEPMQRGADPHAMFLPNESLDRQFRAMGTESRGTISTSTGQAVLIVQPPLETGLAEIVRQRGMLTITVELPLRESLAAGITPVSTPAVLNGIPSPDFSSAQVVRNALAFDDAGQKLILISPSRERARGFGIPLGRLVEFLSEGEFTNLLLLDDSRDLLVPRMDSTRDFREAAITPVRAAIALRPEAPTMEIVGVDANLHRLRSVIVQGTRREFPANRPGALRDENLVQQPGLDNFWAVPTEPYDPELQTRTENPNALLFVLPRPMPVAAIELVHAEAAGFSPQFNLRGWRLLGRERRDVAWRELAVIRHDEPIPRERAFIEGTPNLIELRLEILEPSFLPAGNVARLAEVFLWSTEPEIN